MTGVTLTDGVVLLRAPDEADVPAIAGACQDPEVQRWTTIPVPYATADAEGFVRIVADGWAAWAQQGDAARVGLNWAVRTDAGLAGMIGLVLHDAGSAEVGYWLAPQSRRQGLLHRSLLLVLGWAFDAADGPALERVSWLAYTGNWPSWRAAWGVGFRFEGTPRLEGVQRGRRRDSWFGTLLRDDPRTPTAPWPATPFPGPESSEGARA